MASCISDYLIISIAEERRDVKEQQNRAPTNVKTGGIGMDSLIAC